MIYKETNNVQYISSFGAYASFNEQSQIHVIENVKWVSISL